MKYTVEEVRQYARITDGMVSLSKLSDMLTELAKRIKADERAVPHVTERLVQVAENARVFVLNDATKHPRIGKQELRHIAMRSALLAVWRVRPAQAAQVDPTAKPRTLADFVNAPDAERVQIGQQVAARVDEMMAGPVAHDEACKICGKDTPHHHLRGTAPTPAPPVDLAAVRKVIADIRHWNEAICHPALNVFADELEAALQESKP